MSVITFCHLNRPLSNEHVIFDRENVASLITTSSANDRHTVQIGGFHTTKLGQMTCCKSGASSTLQKYAGNIGVMIKRKEFSL